ncbi:hypothetical protein BJY04DRAFT_188522 [Aspergillus karnatakaensis]|uniref:uncharacterized protein n=1 Tax=Aspergillus karnatakaensis TaxID=1810916 RepID=UPI003CCE3E30
MNSTKKVMITVTSSPTAKQNPYDSHPVPWMTAPYLVRLSNNFQLHIQQALHRRTQELRNSPFMRQTPNKRVPAREHLQPILSPTMPKATLTHPLPSRPSLDQPSIVGIDSPFSNRTSQSTGVESNTTAAANTTSKSPQLSWTSPATQVTMSPQPSTTEALQERLIDNGKDTMAASIGFQNTPPVSRTNSPGGTAIAEPRTANPTIGSEYWARNGNTAPLANHSKSIPRTPYTFAEVLPSANTHASEGSIQTQTEALNSPEHSSVPSPGALASAEGTARPSERPKQERHGPHPPHPLGPFASSLTKEDCLAGALQLLARFAQLETEDQQRTADLRACVNAQQKQLEIIESSGAEQLEALRHQVANMRKDREKERHEIEKEREDVKDRLVRAEEFMTRFSSFFNIMQQHKSDQGAPRQGCEGQQPMPK